VNSAIEQAGLVDSLNTVSADLGFINIHYYAAAASLYGSEVHGGYEYEGLSYQLRGDHVEGYDTCIDCHNPHTLELKLTECATCHEDVATVEDVRLIRMPGSLIDYDGDGDIEEGIYSEIDTLKGVLYEAIQMYASQVAGTPIVYDTLTYPYFFIDANANGLGDAEELNGDNRYNAFTPRLVQATYNYQVSQKDPGGYAHNPKYHVELLYDSIEMLYTEMGMADQMPVGLNRNDPGHFDATAEAFRHWDEDGEVPGACAKCHSAEGLPVFLKNNANIAVEPSNSLACSTCHSAIPEFTLYESNEVVFPSGATITFGEEEPANLCLNCHQARESTVSVNAAITRSGAGPDEVSEALRFRNPHYFAAGATLFGGEAQGAYQFDGKEYSGRNEHERRFDTCTDCHNEHSLEIRADLCVDCHEAVTSVEDVRLIRFEGEDEDGEPYEAVDYDGDGNTTEPIADEVASLEAGLLAVIQNYAANTIGTPIVYASFAYPYWFVDLNANGQVEPEEASFDNAYGQWTPNLLRAAYNYQYVAKDPGAFAHNPDYVLQVLYDSLEALGGPDAVAGYTRAPVEVEE
jgi:hypothetical protein